MDAIFARLKSLQAMKDDIMGDLEEFMDDVETKSVHKAIEFPQQFEEVVDIVVSESRAKASEQLARQEEKEEASRLEAQSNEPGEGQEPAGKASYAGALEAMGLEEREDKPFWAKFLRNDYL